MNTEDNDMPKSINRRELIKQTSAVGIIAMAPHLRAEDTTKDKPIPLLAVQPRLESQRPWLMPAHFGSPEWQGAEGVRAGEVLYDDVTRIAITYLTDEEKLKQFLPRPFELSGPPTVNVTYSMNRGCDWLAGRGYNIVSVSAQATYAGEVDQISGSYALVLWENLTEPILTGREFQGIPKIYGEIEDHHAYKGVWRTTLSNNGKTMLEMQAADLTKMTSEAFETFKGQSQHLDLLGWKYIPNETGSGPIVSYATLFPMSSRYHEAWSAKGTLQWYRRSWEEIPTQAHIVNALHALPIKQVVSCIVAKASVTLHASSVRRLL